MAQAPSHSSNTPDQTHHEGSSRRKAWVIPVIVLVVIVILGSVATFLFMRPSAPPAAWLATANVQGLKMVYFLHWENDNSNLKGTMEVAIYNQGTKQVQATPYPFTGTYNSQDQTVTLNFEEKEDGINVGTLKGKIEGDSLKLRSTDANPRMEPAGVFHPGSGDDYAQAKKDLAK